MNPLRFLPLYQARVWGGTEIGRLFGRTPPTASIPCGESWEIVDRPEAQSVVCDGEWKGLSLHELWTQRRQEIFGNAPNTERFPLLLKILDAREDLSVQVHPPAAVADALRGEPKTEMWYIADAAPGAALYVGVHPGVSRESFSVALRSGTVVDLIHRIPAQRGDFIFIPSGRLHAIGAGLVIFEIQQNSDTTYRVFDWNRTGLDGKTRQLHIAESLACIDFEDTKPTLGCAEGETLVRCDHFHVRKISLPPLAARSIAEAGECAIVVCISGRGTLAGEPVHPGDHLLIPSVTDSTSRTISADTALEFLTVQFA